MRAPIQNAAIRSGGYRDFGSFGQMRISAYELRALGRRVKTPGELQQITVEVARRSRGRKEPRVRALRAGIDGL
jgi:hypothetical protein